MMRKVKVGITGATGYIGSCLCELLVKSGRFEVRGLAHVSKVDFCQDSVEYIIGDVYNLDEMIEFTKGLDIVIHTAAKLGKGKWNEFYCVNVIGTSNIVKACTQNQVKKLIYFSSIEVYGEFNNRRLDESDRLELCGHYYVDSKILAERQIINELSNSLVDYCIVRPGMVYGPGSFFWTMRLYNMALNKKFLIYGDGSSNVFPIYIQNLLDGILKIIYDNHKKQIYNLVDDENVSWRMWGEMFGKIVGDKNVFVQMNPITLTMKGLINKYILHYGKSRTKTVYTRHAKISNNKIKKDLGWRQSVSFAEGMKKSEQWIIDIEAHKKGEKV